MKQMSIPVKPENQLNLKVSEDLFIEGSDENILTAVVRHSDAFKITETNGRIDLKANTDCRLTIPAGMAVTVEKVSGDATVRGLLKRVIVGKVGGDVVLEDIIGASIETVGGDLTLKAISGPVEVARVGGDLFGDGFIGLSSGNIGGDVFLQKASGLITLASGGDIELNLVDKNIEPVSLTAGGDIRLGVVSDAAASLDLHSGGGQIDLSVDDQVGEWEQTEVAIVLAEGGNRVKLTAGGDINISDQLFTRRDFDDHFTRAYDDWADFGFDLQKQIAEGIGMATEQLHWSTQKAQQVSEKARFKVEKAMHRLEEKGITLEHPAKMVGFSYEKPARPKEQKASRVSDEERMMVLKMLQEKKISVEEADKLLTALDK